MATRPFESVMPVPPPEEEALANMQEGAKQAESIGTRPPAAGPDAFRKTEKKAIPGLHAREFASALSVKFGDQLEHLPDNPSNEDMDRLVNQFVQECKAGTFLKVGGESWGQMKDEVLAGLDLAERQENAKERILKRAPGTSKMSKFIAKAKLGIEEGLAV